MGQGFGKLFLLIYKILHFFSSCLKIIFTFIEFFFLSIRDINRT